MGFLFISCVAIGKESTSFCQLKKKIILKFKPQAVFQTLFFFSIAQRAWRLFCRAPEYLGLENNVSWAVIFLPGRTWNIALSSSCPPFLVFFSRPQASLLQILPSGSTHWVCFGSTCINSHSVCLTLVIKAQVFQVTSLNHCFGWKYLVWDKTPSPFYYKTSAEKIAIFYSERQCIPV